MNENTENKTCCCSNDDKFKYRNHEGQDYKKLIARLNRIEGQIRGIKTMVEDDRYCVDILTQVTAVQAALNAFNKELLGQHIHSCVVEDIRDGKDEVVDELVEIVKKLMK
ncbi:MAG: metal-sensing transcriptional repressor [Clostridia bacterium]|nr:metal-sensing transcriptional repressor [Clostridia bacterium]